MTSALASIASSAPRAPTGLTSGTPPGSAADRKTAAADVSRDTPSPHPPHHHSQTGTQTLLRGLAILEAVASGAKDLKTVGAALGTTRSTTHRLVSSLVHARYLRMGPHGLALGPRLIELGATAVDQMPLTTVARPHLDALASVTRDTVHLAVRDGNDVLYIHKIAGTRGLEMRSRVGHRMPLATTGIGRALSLDMTQEDWATLFAIEHQAAMLQHAAFNTHDVSAEANDAFTMERMSAPGATSTQFHRTTGDVPSPETLAVQSDRFVEKMRQYAARGCALDIEENEPSICCVAAPIRDASGAIVAAVSVASTVHYMSAQRMETLAPVVQQHSRAISEELGWRANSASRTIRR